MEGEQKRVFLVITQEEIDGIQPPKGISAAEEIWVSEKLMKQKNPYQMIGKNLHIPVYTCRMEDCVPTIRPKKERTKENAYEL